ncbi:C40 family peptidase [Mucilaginibacter sp. AK015]|uniref:C40 family peptidase n=1 Tax=Mucilaginibacter sp. AK015 TaxID=2723072 RepID=UPI0016205347|nr:C40 family peptidase [Mucilaginibacter sp. AK015]MBB5397802.1 cell wall-associated NlpC family hydrolase [Mucilaginibacter sp. AK015]
MRLPVLLSFLILTLLSCGGDKPTYTITAADTVADTAGRKTVILAPTDGTAGMNNINVGNTTPSQLIAFARTAIGIPYKYGSTDPQQGFDCSGFITYTFNHFGIAVPRTSADFTNVDHEVSLKDARAGDLILFTGTDSTVRIVGHMGIVITNPGEELQFIHSTSGRDNGVTISALTKGYQERFVKVVRIFR